MIEFFAEFLVTDISLCLTAKSITVERVGEHNSSITKLILGKIKKKTKIYCLIFWINLLLVLINVTVECASYFEGTDNFFSDLTHCFELLWVNTPSIMVQLGIIIVLTLLFMVLTYRLVNVKSIDEFPQLDVKQLDKAYIEFTKPSKVDARSTLFLIAGDLSFLGIVPDITSFENLEMKETCKKVLLENSKPHQMCSRNKCPIKGGKCIEKSGQFAQLIQLRHKPVRMNIICKKPEANGDIEYKRRLGRLKEVYGDHLEIHFISGDTLTSQICTLGRIKVNGGRSEMLWHWKDPDCEGLYTAPRIKKDTSGEDKTLIYLIRDVLWKSSDGIEESLMDECVSEYKRALGEVLDES